ncbi:MAG: IS91 family transposase [Mariprofundaceae bacterium]|nr:IS91 family transposase [Mariprofundaceae bacterium]
MLHRYEQTFLQHHTVSAQVLKTFHAIKICRTRKLGGHKKRCSCCDHVSISYNSCRNRHCPKCQNIAKQKWIKQREAELLVVPYFHVVFTLPSEFNLLALSNPKQVYNALFQASWQTIQTFSADPKHLGAKTGMTAVLHTWGQTLSLHPHLHCIVPGGGLNAKGEWVLPKKSTKRSIRNQKYLYPTQTLSAVYRAKFMSCLREQITIPQQIAKAVMYKDWVVYAKRPFLGPKQVIEYLGRYTHKIAISNHRLLSINNRRITFGYKDYRASGANKKMTLSSIEFIRRFSMHILPHGFTRIRHYGILASKNKAIDLNKAKTYFGLGKWIKQEFKWEDIASERLNIIPNQCPKCKKLTLEVIEIIHPMRGPPSAIKPNNDF